MPIRTTPSGKRRVEVPVPPDVQAKLGVTKLSQLVEPGMDPGEVTRELLDVIERERGPSPLRIVIEGVDAVRDAWHLARIEDGIRSVPGMANAKISFSKPRS